LSSFVVCPSEDDATDVTRVRHNYVCILVNHKCTNTCGLCLSCVCVNIYGLCVL